MERNSKFIFKFLMAIMVSILLFALNAQAINSLNDLHHNGPDIGQKSKKHKKISYNHQRFHQSKSICNLGRKSSSNGSDFQSGGNFNFIYEFKIKYFDKVESYPKIIFNSSYTKYAFSGRAPPLV